ncbi:hypothetical protein [Metapseudomonas otitidis]|uniref:hypothetical protein n=1 Tax=Metapseudomonas otitidis TaxID=319939 RepID=UPI0013F6029A|nr:hypothetical protein [Pseudomonas otitidis]
MNDLFALHRLWRSSGSQGSKCSRPDRERRSAESTEQVVLISRKRAVASLPCNHVLGIETEASQQAELVTGNWDLSLPSANSFNRHLGNACNGCLTELQALTFKFQSLAHRQR